MRRILRYSRLNVGIDFRLGEKIEKIESFQIRGRRTFPKVKNAEDSESEVRFSIGPLVGEILSKNHKILMKYRELSGFLKIRYVYILKMSEIEKNETVS